MIKIFCLSLLPLSALFFSFSYMQKEKKRLIFIKNISELFFQIGKQIEHFATPMEEIMQRCAERFPELFRTKDFSLNSLERLIEDELDGREKQLALDFCRQLGRDNKEETVKLCRYYSSQMKELYEALDSEFPKKRKLTYTLSICMALGLLILLI